MSKIKVIIDTDYDNELDDYFALTYLLKSLDKFDLQAITIAPFSHNGEIEKIKDNNISSYNNVLKTLELLNLNEYKEKVYIGASNYLNNEMIGNDASDQIIKIARENEFTTIIAIGAITNVAIALLKAEDIQDKIHIIWLGGNAIDYKDKNNEYNFIQDVKAAEVVVNSKAKLSIIPCKGVASYMISSYPELDKYLPDDNGINNFLKERVKYVVTNKWGWNINGFGLILWDVSAIALALKVKKVETTIKKVKGIREDTSYIFDDLGKEVEFVTSLNRDDILRDYFSKMNPLFPL